MLGIDRLKVLTIGHSTHQYERFLALLRGAGVTAVADVRTAPFSRYSPHFNREQIRCKLRLDGIAYAFLGQQLGGRPQNRISYCNGIADYEKMATTGEFKAGLDRILDGAKRYRIVLMCSEHDPLDCHRCLLVGRALAEQDVQVDHILHNATAIDHAEIEERLLTFSGRGTDDLLMSRDDRLSLAYRERARKVAFADSSYLDRDGATK